MATSTLLALTLIGAVLPFALALIISLRPTATPTSVEDYFLFQRKLTPSLFLRSSVGYSLQVAAIFLFIAWYFAYGITCLFVPVCWYAGYWLQKKVVQSKRIDSFLGSSQSGVSTIHGFIYERAKNRWLLAVVSVTTVCGLAGTLIGEMDYSTNFLLPALGLPKDAWTTFAVHSAVLFFASSYVLWGGFRASVFTDAMQVPVAYFSFAVVVLGAVMWSAQRGAGPDASVLAFVLGLTFAGFLWNRHRILAAEPDYPIARDRLLFGSLVLLCVMVGTFSAFQEETADHLSMVGPLHSQLLGSSSLTLSFGGFLGFGVLGTISLVITNAVWQFVDISSLQRLQAVSSAAMLDTTGTPVEIADRRRPVLLGINAAGVESGGSWVITLVLAVVLKLGGVASDSAVPTAFTAGDNVPSWVLPVFAFSMVTFMLSTLSAMISAIAFVSYFDLMPLVRGGAVAQAPRGGEVVTSRKDIAAELWLPRVISLIALLAVYALWVVLKQMLGNQTGPALYAVYAVQLSAGVVIGIALFRPNRLRVAPALLSVIVGWIAALYTAFKTPIWGISDASWYVIPPLAVFCASSLAYVVLYAIVSVIQPQRGPDRE